MCIRDRCCVDEGHHGKSKTSRQILTKLSGCHYYIGLTATPPKEKTLELAELVSIIGPVLFDYGLETAIKNGNVAPIKCFFLKTPESFHVKELVFNRRNYQVIWNNGVRDNEKRNKAIADICRHLHDLIGVSTLINVDRVEHGSSIQYELFKSKLSSVEMYGDDIVTIRNAKIQRLMQNSVNILLTSVVREGVDLPIAPPLAINASGKSKFIGVVQFLGRSVRKNEKFGSFRALVDFYDTCHPLLQKHSEDRMSACRDEGLEVIVVDSVSDLLQQVVTYYNQCMSTSEV